MSTVASSADVCTLLIFRKGPVKLPVMQLVKIAQSFLQSVCRDQFHVIFLTLRWPRRGAGGGGGSGCHAPTGFSNFSLVWEELLCKLHF